MPDSLREQAERLTQAITPDPRPKEENSEKALVQRFRRLPVERSPVWFLTVLIVTIGTVLLAILSWSIYHSNWVERIFRDPVQLVGDVRWKQDYRQSPATDVATIDERNAVISTRGSGAQRIRLDGGTVGIWETFDAANTEGRLPDPNLRQVHFDDTRIYFVGDKGSLSSCNRKFQDWRLHYGGGGFVPNLNLTTEMTGLAVNPDQFLFAVGTKKNGVGVYDLTTRQWSLILHAPEYLPDDRIHAVRFIHERLWVATGKGLRIFELDRKGVHVRATPVGWDLPDAFQGRPVTALSESDGVVDCVVGRGAHLSIPSDGGRWRVIVDEGDKRLEGLNGQAKFPDSVLVSDGLWLILPDGRPAYYNTARRHLMLAQEGLDHQGRWLWEGERQIVWLGDKNGAVYQRDGATWKMVLPSEERVKDLTFLDTTPLAHLESGVVRQYRNDGTPIRSFFSPAQFSSPLGAAEVGADRLFVSDAKGIVHRYLPTLRSWESLADHRPIPVRQLHFAGNRLWVVKENGEFGYFESLEDPNHQPHYQSLFGLSELPKVSGQVLTAESFQSRLWFVRKTSNTSPRIYVYDPQDKTIRTKDTGIVGTPKALRVVQNTLYLWTAEGRIFAHTESGDWTQILGNRSDIVEMRATSQALIARTRSGDVLIVRPDKPPVTLFSGQGSLRWQQLAADRFGRIWGINDAGTLTHYHKATGTWKTHEAGTDFLIQAQDEENDRIYLTTNAGVLTWSTNSDEANSDGKNSDKELLLDGKSVHQLDIGGDRPLTLTGDSVSREILDASEEVLLWSLSSNGRYPSNKDWQNAVWMNFVDEKLWWIATDGTLWHYRLNGPREWGHHRLQGNAPLKRIHLSERGILWWLDVENDLYAFLDGKTISLRNQYFDTYEFEQVATWAREMMIGAIIVATVAAGIAVILLGIWFQPKQMVGAALYYSLFIMGMLLFLWLLFSVLDGLSDVTMWFIFVGLGILLARGGLGDDMDADPPAKIGIWAVLFVCLVGSGIILFADYDKDILIYISVLLLSPLVLLLVLGVLFSLRAKRVFYLSLVSFLIALVPASTLLYLTQVLIPAIRPFTEMRFSNKVLDYRLDDSELTVKTDEGLWRFEIEELVLSPKDFSPGMNQLQQDYRLTYPREDESNHWRIDQNAQGFLLSHKSEDGDWQTLHFGDAGFDEDRIESFAVDRDRLLAKTPIGVAAYEIDSTWTWCPEGMKFWKFCFSDTLKWNSFTPLGPGSLVKDDETIWYRDSNGITYRYSGSWGRTIKPWPRKIKKNGLRWERTHDGDSLLPEDFDVRDRRLRADIPDRLLVDQRGVSWVHSKAGWRKLQIDSTGVHIAEPNQLIPQETHPAIWKINTMWEVRRTTGINGDSVQFRFRPATEKGSWIDDPFEDRGRWPDEYARSVSSYAGQVWLGTPQGLLQQPGGIIALHSKDILTVHENRCRTENGSYQLTEEVWEPLGDISLGSFPDSRSLRLFLGDGLMVKAIEYRDESGARTELMDFNGARFQQDSVQGIEGEKDGFWLWNQSGVQRIYLSESGIAIQRSDKLKLVALRRDESWRLYGLGEDERVWSYGKNWTLFEEDTNPFNLPVRVSLSNRLSLERHYHSSGDYYRLVTPLGPLDLHDGKLAIDYVLVGASEGQLQGTAAGIITKQTVFPYPPGSKNGFNLTMIEGKPVVRVTDHIFQYREGNWNSFSGDALKVPRVYFDGLRWDLSKISVLQPEFAWKLAEEKHFPLILNKLGQLPFDTVHNVLEHASEQWILHDRGVTVSDTGTVVPRQFYDTGEFIQKAGTLFSDQYERVWLVDRNPKRVFDRNVFRHPQPHEKKGFENWSEPIWSGWLTIGDVQAWITENNAVAISDGKQQYETEPFSAKIIGVTGMGSLLWILTEAGFYRTKPMLLPKSDILRNVFSTNLPNWFKNERTVR
uniref:Uncharacterized protein n=1 Tax=Candidatus Kentrum sp. FM TaxID=2126340 RepID=A0A450RUE3_9GAMM|nr:MAG: hypothetical protein BECKFM1743A_GA0114220_1000116 [Candidatus Kentron sp. FM]VFJ43358.1 MAG: hypothetical protein BECKFM1743C_GA0114222_1000116 [Candidatus Kentron sp. FM]